MDSGEQFDGIVGQSEPIRALVDMILKIAPHNFAVLVRGESGTGKELIARAIQRNSKREKGPFVPVNCGAIPESLMEAHLFGYQKGAFTGATSDKPGLFEAANGGTIFLDEIGEMPPPMQVKLLRVLQEGEIVRVGGTKPITVDVRLIAATNRDLKKMIARRRFREDLYYRISTLEIEAPALRERREDIPILALHFVEKFCRQAGFARDISIHQDALELLKNHDWPGNVRELENVINRLLVLCGEPTIPAESVSRVLGSVRTQLEPGQPELRTHSEDRLLLPSSILEIGEHETLTSYLNRVKREALQTTIAQFQDRAACADRLGLARDTMRKLEKRVRKQLRVFGGEPVIAARPASTVLGIARWNDSSDQSDERGHTEDAIVLLPSILELREGETMEAYLRRVKCALLQTAVAQLPDRDACAERLGLAKDTMRKLATVINRALVLGRDSVIPPESRVVGGNGAVAESDQSGVKALTEDRIVLPPSILKLAEAETMTAYLRRVKCELLRATIAQLRNGPAAAERLGLAKDTMRKHLRRLRGPRRRKPIAA